MPPTLVDAVLAKQVSVAPDGNLAMVDRIIDRQEFVCPVPSEFSASLGFIFRADPNSSFPIATEVRSHMGKVIAYDSGTLVTPQSGQGQFAAKIPIPVGDVGPCRVSLSFDGKEVWSQTIFFALA